MASYWVHGRDTRSLSFSSPDSLHVFSNQFIIKGDVKIFNLLRQGLLHSLIFKSYNFTSLPLSCKLYNLCFLRVYELAFNFTPQVSIFLRQFWVSSVTVLRCFSIITIPMLIIPQHLVAEANCQPPHTMGVVIVHLPGGIL